MNDIKPIPLADSLFDGKTKMLARFSDSTGWSAFNPSITSTPDLGYIVLLRSANSYMQDHRPERRTEYGEELSGADSFIDANEWEGYGTYTSLWNGEPKYRNKMFLAKFDPKKMSLGLLHEIDTSATEAAAPVPLNRGLEDGRVYHDGESLRISCTAFEPNHPPHNARIASVRLDVPSFDKPAISEFVLFDSPKSVDTVEKNWMPVVKGEIPEDERPSWDYIYETGATYTIATNKMERVGGYELPLRGGSQLVRTPKGTYLAVMHQMISNEFMRFSDIKKSPLAKRRYAHRFVEFNQLGQVINVSDKFTFMNKSIEFASGLTFHQDRLFVTYGVMDCYSFVSSLSYEAVMSSMRPPQV
jgi:hypothetical protein